MKNANDFPVIIWKVAAPVITYNGTEIHVMSGSGTCKLTKSIGMDNGICTNRTRNAEINSSPPDRKELARTNTLSVVVNLFIVESTIF